MALGNIKTITSANEFVPEEEFNHFINNYELRIDDFICNDLELPDEYYDALEEHDEEFTEDSGIEPKDIIVSMIYDLKDVDTYNYLVEEIGDMGNELEWFNGDCEKEEKEEI